jgi:2-methylcitrate dehydratase PrpD
MQPGFAAKAGVFSDLLAERGLTGAKNIIQGPWGFFSLYGDRRIQVGEEMLTRWREKLAKEYEVVNLSAKPYPCCRMTHGAIDAALSLIREHGIKEKDVKEVEVHTSPVGYDTVGHPFEIRDNPQVDGQFSIPYTVAVAIQRGKVVLDDFEEAVVLQPRNAELAKKVVVQGDKSLPKWSTVVTFQTLSGKSFSKRIDVMKGHPQNPLTREEFLEKFRDCARHAAKPIKSERLEEILASLESIEKIKDMNQLVKLITG